MLDYIKEITVVFEVISSWEVKLNQKPISKRYAMLSEDEITFLPIVTRARKNRNRLAQKITPRKIHLGQRVSASKLKQDIDKDSSTTLNFLPLVISDLDEKQKASYFFNSSLETKYYHRLDNGVAPSFDGDGSLLPINDAILFSRNITLDNLFNIETIVEEDDSATLTTRFSFLEGLVDWSEAFDIQFTNLDLPNYESNKSSKLQNINNAVAIPVPVFYDSEIEQTLKMLLDIQLLGDHREIPFLKSILKTTPYPIIRDRVLDIVKDFSAKSDYPQPPISSLELARSVFSPLILISDLESKLMLLDEIATIGNEKEFPLLKNLMTDSNSRISNKAESVYKDLRWKLLEEAETLKRLNTVNSFEEGVLLDINFELDLIDAGEVELLVEKPAPKAQQVFLNKLSQYSNKIIKKLSHAIAIGSGQFSHMK